ncbi:uncharacterized protein LOC110876368 [Helianthus annuus]|uniref:uncharacterized protein LOC110876368 n=1 Tax=Helianthus annuus TaxID=4232 RepID=UPI000B9002FC|nr:uncharacterized protein LOC110876368 [Helianthus annuus]
MVADRMELCNNAVEFKWSWVRSMLNYVENGQLQQLIGMIGGSNIGSGNDSWKWKYEASGEFSVANVKKVLNSVARVRPSKVFEWNNWVPKKVALVAWRAEMERLPAKLALSARNIPVQNQLCAMCGEYEESSEHLFVSCHFAQIIWQNIVGWCTVPPIIAFDVKDLLMLHGFSPGSGKKRKAFYAIVLVSFWSQSRLKGE